MPLEQRPSVSSAHRSTSSINNETDSATSTPPQQNKTKGGQQKHVGHTGHAGHVVVKHQHTRVPSAKGLHKHTRESSHTDLKKLGHNRNASTTSLGGKNRNNSHVTLRRNRSTADVPKTRPKSPKSAHPEKKRPNSVHFEIGSQSVAAEAEDGWEEASSSASPALSRSASRLGSAQSSSKPSANNSQPHSPNDSPLKPRKEVINGRHIADAKVITERLLQRTPSQLTTKMSLATATPTSQAHSLDPDSLPPTTNSSGGKDEIVSRFVNGGSSGTPAEGSSFLRNKSPPRADGSSPRAANDEVKRAKSMGNLTRHNSENTENEELESALAPRSRKSSTHAYIAPQQSRTQQKLWLQRASSNIEPQAGVRGGVALGSGPGYDGRGPAIRSQLEKTGLEYLVVRRYQDPVGAALKRLPQLPGNEKMRRIPNGRATTTLEDAGNGRHGLSQSLREQRRSRGGDTPARTSFETTGPGSQGDGRSEEDDGVSAILRSVWEKNYEIAASQ